MRGVEKDYCSVEGAAELKTMVEQYWRQKGYAIEIELVPAGFHGAMRSCRVDVRSNLMNGLPAS